MCAINQIMGIPCGEAKPIIVEKEILKQPVMIYPIAAPFCNEKWNYNMHGSDWECNCADGYWQSPVALPETIYGTPVENYVVLDYKEQKIGWDKLPLAIKIDENMLRIKGDFGSMQHTELEHINFEGLILTRTVPISYRAQELQFHTPSDHQINRKQYPMEIQIYHEAQTEGQIKKKAIVAFLFEQQAGKRNKFIDELPLMELPTPYNTDKELKKPVNIYDILIDPDLVDKMTPGSNATPYRPFSYFIYEGSLTSPPCDEFTRLIVKSDPILINYTALDLLRDVMNPQPLMGGGSGCSGPMSVGDMNVFNNLEGTFRLQQPITGRTIYYYDASACNPDQSRYQLPGHYEKIKKKVNQYVFVPGPTPSTLPNAFVVDEKEAKGLLPNLEEMRRKLKQLGQDGFKVAMN
jgi:carbonic anhydrase